jgi:hypothetical protein
VQRRYCDPGFPYSTAAFQALYGGTFSPGVYSGIDLALSPLSGSQIVINPGFFFVPTPEDGGVLVEETEAVTIPIANFPPSTATNYTVCSRYSPAAMGLLGGTAVIYYVTALQLSTQPSDGCILGWINHPGGSLPLSSDYITQAPKQRLWEFGLSMMNRRPIHTTAPDLVAAIGANTTAASGYDATDKNSWRGFFASATSSATIAYYHFPVRVRPYRFRLRSSIPLGQNITVQIYDTARALSVTQGLTSHVSFGWDNVVIPPSGGTWTLGESALVVMSFTVPPGTTFKVTDLFIDSWPYPLPSY